MERERERNKNKEGITRREIFTSFELSYFNYLQCNLITQKILKILILFLSPSPSFSFFSFFSLSLILPLKEKRGMLVILFKVYALNLFK